MLQQIFFGMLLGWGAAIPIGPINLEIIRRNLTFGSTSGTLFGLGACSADISYLLLLSFGTLAILNHPIALQVIGIIGSLILSWFGYCALRLKTKTTTAKKLTPYSFSRHGIEGYLLTLFNPVTILFWSSVSAQIASTIDKNTYSPAYAGAGVLIGTFSWVIVLNVILHFTQHRLPSNIMNYLNFVGGIILLGFAGFGLWHAFSSL